jgi:predicted transcriptional regulator
MRTIVDIPDSVIKKLDKLARKKQASRAELVRRAVQNYIRDLEHIPSFDEVYGLWKDRADIGDSVEYQRKMRKEWDERFPS